MTSDPGSSPALSPAERNRLGAIRSAESLADLVRITGADSEHAAYFEAKREWHDLRGKELSSVRHAGGLPGCCVAIGGRAFTVHGVTHADTDEERELLHEHVSRFVEDGDAVYCEQGIRPMYFSGFPDVRQMDDYAWAMDRCRELGIASRLAEDPAEFDGVLEDVNSAAARFRDAVFSLIDSGSDLYGGEYTRSLGDVASQFLMSHEDFATGRDFTSFTLTRAASLDPSRLPELQRYYETAFLPQPLERAWLRRHDRELELFTHARNERMADYLVHHSEEAADVHAILGAAHQPGVRYYLERHRDGYRSTDDFEFVG